MQHERTNTNWERELNTLPPLHAASLSKCKSLNQIIWYLKVYNYYHRAPKLEKIAIPAKQHWALKIIGFIGGDSSLHKKTFRASQLKNIEASGSEMIGLWSPEQTIPGSRTPRPTSLLGSINMICNF